jgi:hypothetical protein
MNITRVHIQYWLERKAGGFPTWAVKAKAPYVLTSIHSLIDRNCKILPKKYEMDMTGLIRLISHRINRNKSMAEVLKDLCFNSFLGKRDKATCKKWYEKITGRILKP